MESNDKGVRLTDGIIWLLRISNIIICCIACILTFNVLKHVQWLCAENRNIVQHAAEQEQVLRNRFSEILYDFSQRIQEITASVKALSLTTQSLKESLELLKVSEAQSSGNLDTLIRKNVKMRTSIQDLTNALQASLDNKIENLSLIYLACGVDGVVKEIEKMKLKNKIDQTARWFFVVQCLSKLVDAAEVKSLNTLIFYMIKASDEVLYDKTVCILKKYINFLSVQRVIPAMLIVAQGDQVYVEYQIRGLKTGFSEGEEISQIELSALINSVII